MKFAVYYPSTEGLETVIYNLATRQQLFSFPEKSLFLGLWSESGIFFGKKVQEWSVFGHNEISA